VPAITTRIITDLDELKSNSWENKSLKPPKQEPIASGDEIMVLFRGCRLGKTEQVVDWIDENENEYDRMLDRLQQAAKKNAGADNNDNNVIPASSLIGNLSVEKELAWDGYEVALSFQFGTNEKDYNGMPLGPFAGIQPGDQLPIKSGIVLLPRVKVSDYFTLRITLTSTYWIIAKIQEITQILQFVAKHVPGIIPVAGPYVSQAVGIIGDILAIAVALYKDRALIRELKSFLLADVKDIHGEILKTGWLDIVEESKGNTADDKSIIRLEIVKLKAKATRAREKAQKRKR
jgi:hypothetical protein